jgi:hypothetical protein
VVNTTLYLLFCAPLSYFCFVHYQWTSGPHGYDGMAVIWNGSATGDLNELKYILRYNVEGLLEYVQIFNGTGSGWDLTGEWQLMPIRPTLQPIIYLGYNVSLTWNAVETAISYYIYRDTVPITQTSMILLTPIKNTTLTSYTDVVIPGVYYYAVIADDTVRNSSISNCEQVNVTPPIPTPPVLTSIESLNDLVTLTWTISDYATIYYIYRSTSNITSVIGLTPIDTTNDLYYLDQVESSGTYYYVIVAGNIYGNSTKSNCKNVHVTIPKGGVPGFTISLCLIPLIFLATVISLINFWKKKEKLQTVQNII